MDGLKYKHENGTNIFGVRVNNFPAYLIHASS